MDSSRNSEGLFRKSRSKNLIRMPADIETSLDSKSCTITSKDNVIAHSFLINSSSRRRSYMLAINPIKPSDLDSGVQPLYPMTLAEAHEYLASHEDEDPHQRRLAKKRSKELAALRKVKQTVKKRVKSGMFIPNNELSTIQEEEEEARSDQGIDNPRVSKKKQRLPLFSRFQSNAKHRFTVPHPVPHFRKHELESIGCMAQLISDELDWMSDLIMDGVEEDSVLNNTTNSDLTALSTMDHMIESSMIFEASREYFLESTPRKLSNMHRKSAILRPEHSRDLPRQDDASFPVTASAFNLTFDSVEEPDI